MILGAGPLIDAERLNSRLLAVVRAAHERGEEVHTSQAVVAQVVRNPARQVRLLGVLRGVEIHGLDNGIAVGKRLTQSGTADVVDAHLAVLAERLDTFVLTTDPDDMRALGAEFAAY